ncbi:HAD-IIA family hydrolase [Canibacter sp. lx-45]|uniref:HAD-IIA family hydrolase n=1 Tax=Canibacter zhuwentaonis TaxID=2837491 RepID=UPI001BDD5DE6|nr:HAD-IIA family hydrolase [Canibacter zhuwentaonis]
MALFRKAKNTPLDGVEALIADLDGVVYRGHLEIPGAVVHLNRAAERMRVGYLTNNAARTDEQVAAQLTSFGLRITPQDVVTSPQAAVQILRDTVPDGALVFVVGGEGLSNELDKAGYRVTRSAADKPDVVVQGFAQDVGWRELAEASFALAEKPGEPLIPWIATNTDWTIPVPRGTAPGNGSLVSAVHNAVQRLPRFAGKPELAIYQTAFARFGVKPGAALMVGDRLDTDIKGAKNAGMKALHVLTGVDRPKQLLAASADMRPDYIVADLGQLYEPYPETVIARDSAVRVGGAKVRVTGQDVEILQEGSSPLDLLRAGCQAIYRSGLAVYGLRVPEILVADYWRAAE